MSLSKKNMIDAILAPVEDRHNILLDSLRSLVDSAGFQQEKMREEMKITIEAMLEKNDRVEEIIQQLLEIFEGKQEEISQFFLAPEMEESGNIEDQQYFEKGENDSRKDEKKKGIESNEPLEPKIQNGQTSLDDLYEVQTIPPQGGSVESLFVENKTGKKGINQEVSFNKDLAPHNQEETDSWFDSEFDEIKKKNTKKE